MYLSHFWPHLIGPTPECGLVDVGSRILVNGTTLPRIPSREARLSVQVDRHAYSLLGWPIVDYRRHPCLFLPLRRVGGVQGLLPLLMPMLLACAVGHGDARLHTGRPR